MVADIIRNKHDRVSGPYWSPVFVISLTQSEKPHIPFIRHRRERPGRTEMRLTRVDRDVAFT